MNTTDTITINSITDALAALELAVQGMANLKRDAEASVLSPAEAAADFREILNNIKAIIP